MGRPTLAFVCVQNAGRSQMAAAFARRENRERGLNARIMTGGTQPADQVHPEVVEVMVEEGIDLTDTKPRRITPEELHICDITVTMGCAAEDVCPSDYCGEARDWGLEDPHGKDLEVVRSIRDDIKNRVHDLFEELSVETT